MTKGGAGVATEVLDEQASLGNDVASQLLQALYGDEHILHLLESQAILELYGMLRPGLQPPTVACITPHHLVELRLLLLVVVVKKAQSQAQPDTQQQRARQRQKRRRQQPHRQRLYTKPPEEQRSQHAIQGEVHRALLVLGSCNEGAGGLHACLGGR